MRCWRPPRLPMILACFSWVTAFFQLLANQRPDAILARDYIATFKVLPLYDIDQCWLCAASLRERGLSEDAAFVLPARCLEPDALRERLDEYTVVMTF